MPKQNRPLVRDGRLQAPPKKRTDRSYLTPAGTMPAADDVEDAVLTAPAADEVIETAAPAPEAPPPDSAPETVAEAATPAPPTPVPAAAAAAPPASSAEPAPAPRTGKLPSSVRAIQQQGVRKRRDIDLDALAARDTNYALHEIRRIAILTAMVIATLAILTFVLR